MRRRGASRPNMVVLDIGLLVALLLSALSIWMLVRDWAILRKVKTHIDFLGQRLEEREALILRLTHELEKHGCDDLLLLEEARQVCQPIQSNEPKEFKV